MLLTFGGIPYTGIALDRVTLPWHQDPRHFRNTPSPPHHQQHTNDINKTPNLFHPTTEPIAPFFDPSYHTPNITPFERHNLRIQELHCTIRTLQLLGYDLQPHTPVSYGYYGYGLGREVASLTFFHHFTDPNARMMALIETAHRILDQLSACMDEAYVSEEVESGKDEVYKGGFEVAVALERLVERWD